MSNLHNLPIRNEDDHIIEAAKDSIGFGRILTFNKGDYSIDKEDVPLGTEFKAHTREWIQVWVNFGVRPVLQQIYQVALGQKAPARQTLGDLDRDKWEIGFNDEKKDPWVLQFLVPFESLETGEIVAFRTPSSSGRRVVAELCSLCAFKSRRGEPSLPIIKLGKTTFVSSKFGKIVKPEFIILGFEQDVGARHEINVNSLGNSDGSAGHDDEDQIPF